MGISMVCQEALLPPGVSGLRRDEYDGGRGLNFAHQTDLAQQPVIGIPLIRPSWEVKHREMSPQT
jgi:hypothetical protein